MTDQERALLKSQAELKCKLAEVEASLQSIKSEKRRIEEIKKHYHRNAVPPKFQMNWKGLAECLMTGLQNQAKDETSAKEISEYITKAKNLNSYRLPDDPTKLWDCPICGHSDCLRVEDFGRDEFHPKYAVTCTKCDFVAPSISDYGEAWCEFEDWLVRHGYLQGCKE